ncbi:MAG: hypothetical protein JSV03_13115, partial [Planctomycetota bacterium]
MANHKRWIELVLSHQEPASTPYNFMFSPPARRRLEVHYGTANIEDILEMPIRMTGLQSIKPLYSKPAEFGPTVKDEFGVVWSTSEIDRGSPIVPCLPDPDLSNYGFPDPAASYRFQNVGQWCKDNREHYTIIWVGDLWERATFMRGAANILLDLAINQGFVEQLLRNLTDNILETMKILFEGFQFDGIALSDDYGTQRAMLFSPDDWRKLIKPRLTEIYTFAHTHGRTVFHHCCGNIEPIIPELIEIGLDILHPIQPEAMDVFKIKHEF